jgi:hypothetical protein
MVDTFWNSSELSLVYEAMLPSTGIEPKRTDEYKEETASLALSMEGTSVPTRMHRMMLLDLGLFKSRLFR